MFTSRTLWEGRWTMGALIALGLAGWFYGWMITVVALLLLAFTLWFFRDPTRPIPAEPSAIVAPADGKVVEICTVPEPRFMESDATRVAIFLSVFDVHVQRAPLDGTLAFVEYTAGQFLDVRKPQAPAVNESRWIGIQSPDGFRVTVRQMAGLIARRIVGWSEKGATLRRGDRFGMIRFGSRVELYLPTGTEITVCVGQRVKGGETIVARKR